MEPASLLTVNTGSSSLKASLYPCDGEAPASALRVSRIGTSDAVVTVSPTGAGAAGDRYPSPSDHGQALDVLLQWLESARTPAAIGHRVVHGGPRFSAPQLVDDDLLAALHSLIPVDPEHLPQAISAIERLRCALPGVPQVACFDTAFHRTMPAVAQCYALPKQYSDAGVIRYGFHGLSCEYIVQRLHDLDPAAAGGRVVIAHLGNGASMTAVREGRSVETTMGFSPTGGIVMSTRTGDLDPGVIVYLQREAGLSLDAAGRMLNQESGMRAVSGSSGDMQDLLEREARDPRAADAIDLFCYSARKALGSLAAALGGLDTLVFTGGIGEHAAPVRARICAGLEFLGIRLNPERNRAHAPLISPDGAPVAVRVIPTDEELMIVRHIRAVLSHES